jgi:inhibitor of KinA sporulation pathway (predicted exonuclease)
MRYVIVDLEATCWKTGGSPDKMEIIEIGAAMMESASGPIVNEFSSFVRPVASGTLSEFCTELTTITQADVDAAEPFYAVFPRFVDWIGAGEFRICSWGGYDLNQFRRDCERHKFVLPPVFDGHINLKKEFSRWKQVKPTGMSGALAMLGQPLVGTHHRGIDDARNIARLAQQILPWLEKCPQHAVADELVGAE